MLADPAVDVVTIGTPSGAHLEPAVAAARAGKHVIVEKPLEITLKRCDQIIRECEKNRVKLSAIFPSRFHQSSIELKRAVDAGRFGRLTLGDSYVKWFRTQAYYDSGAWRGTWELDGGGALMNQAIHSVDILAWLMGPVVEITAHTALAGPRADRRRRHGRGDAQVCQRRAGRDRSQHGGLSGLSQTDRDARLAGQRRDGGRRRRRLGLRQEDARRRGGPRANGQPAPARPAAPAIPTAIGYHGHTAQFRDVLDAIRDNRQPAIDGHEGRTIGRDHPGRLQSRRDRQSRQAAAKKRSRAGGAEEAEIGGETCS